MTQYVVTNECFGGFGLSEAAEERLRAEGMTWMWGYDIPRDDPRLVAVVHEMGADANGPSAALAIVQVPDGVEWEIEEHDGTEWVAEKHREWTSMGERS